MKTLTLAAATATVALGLFALTGTAEAGQPSFNCRYASTATEVAICNSSFLGRLDRNLAYWYGRAKVRASYFGQVGWLKSTEQSWIYERDACGYDKSCIADAYTQRIQELRQYATHV